MTELSDIYRQVFALRDLEEMNIEETAEALGITTAIITPRLAESRVNVTSNVVALLDVECATRRCESC